MTDDDDDRFCAECGDPEFDKKDEETHAYDDYDHDFVPDEEDENQSTLEQVGELADTVKKIAEAGVAVKKFTKTDTPRPPYDPPLQRRLPDDDYFRDNNSSSKIVKEKKDWTKRAIIITIVVAVILTGIGMWWTSYIANEQNGSEIIQGENIINESPGASIVDQDITINNAETVIVNPPNENSEENNNVLSYQFVLQTYEKNRPYTFSVSSCSFSTIISKEGERSWEFQLKPIMLNNKSQTALIPFNLSYNFDYEGLTDDGWRSLRNTTSENSQKHPYDFKEIGMIRFSQITSALMEAESNNITTVRIIKDKTAFNPYSEEIDDNLEDSYIRDGTDRTVIQFVFNDEWIEDSSVKDSMCHDRYEF